VPWPKRGAEVLFALTLLLALVSLALACLPSMSDRPGSELPEDRTDVGDTRADQRRSELIGALPWVTLGVVVVSLGWLFFARPMVTGMPDQKRTVLPWLSLALDVSIAAQGVLLVAMVAVLLAMRPKKRDPAVGPAWGGFATAVLMLFGSALSGTYAASLVLAVAHLLGRRQPRHQGVHALVISTPISCGPGTRRPPGPRPSPGAGRRPLSTPLSARSSPGSSA
jgi:hypothetical protein